MASAERLQFTTRRFSAQEAANGVTAQGPRYTGGEDHENSRHFSAPPTMRMAFAGNNGKTFAAGPQQHIVPTLNGDEPVKPYKASQKPWRLAFGALMMALLVIAWVVIPIGFLFGYMFFWHTTTRKGNTLETGADPTNLLGIVGFITKSTEQCTVIIMGLMATSAAAKWWHATQSRHQDERPTGVQLGLAMDLMNSANIWAAFDGIAFLFGLKKAKPHRSIRMPSYVRNAIFLLIWLLTLHYAISGLDNALHFTTDPAAVTQETIHSIDKTGFYHDLTLNFSSVTPHTKTVKDLQLPYGRPFNVSKCEDYRKSYNATLGSHGDSCFTTSGGTNRQYIFEPSYLQTLSNSSDLFSVAWTDDGTAITVPARTVNISYTARALGIKSQCTSITNRCVKCSYDADLGANRCDTVAFSPQSILNFECPNLNTTSPYPDTSLYAEGVIDPATNSVYQYTGENAPFASQYAQSNPFRYAFVAESFAYAGMLNATHSEGALVGNTGFIVWGHRGGLNVIDCSVTVLETEYEFTPPTTYHIKSSSLAPLNMTTFVSVNNPTSDRITMQIEGAGLYNDSMPFAEAAALQLSRQYLAFASSLIDTEPATSLLGFRVQGAIMSATVFGAYLALAMLYLLTAILVSINAIISTLRCKYPAQSLVQARLLKPYAVLADAYGRRTTDARHSLTRSGFRTFDPQHDADRLDVVEVYEPANRLWRVNAMRAGSSVPHGHAQHYHERSSDEK